MSGARIRVRKGSGTGPGCGLQRFTCSGCGIPVVIELYVIAQTAMGHELTHTHDCGAIHHLSKGPIVRAAAQKQGGGA